MIPVIENPVSPSAHQLDWSGKQSGHQRLFQSGNEEGDKRECGTLNSHCQFLGTKQGLSVYHFVLCSVTNPQHYI